MMRSFLPVTPDSHFPIQNLPVGMFHRPGEGSAHAGVAIGEHILDLRVLEDLGLLLPHERFFGGGSLNPFLAAGKETWTAVRARVQALLSDDEPTLRDDAETL